MAKQPKKNLKKRTRDSNGVPMAGGGGCDDSAAALPTMASTHVDPLDGVEHPPQAPSSLQQDPSAAELTLATLSSSLTGSSSADSASSSGSSDGTSSSTGSSSSGKEDDSERRYPRFSASYARTFKHDMTPFVRVIDEVKTPSKIASSSKPLMDARRNSNSLVHVGSNESSEFHSALSSPFTSPKMAGIASPNAKNAAKKSAATTATANNNNNVTAAPANPERIVILYGTYRMVKLLGRGTFSKVVRALRINDGSNLVSSRSQVLEVAIKIFRDRNSYREACWEEITILQALCQNNFPITNVTGASSCAGMADVMMCASSEGRFIPMLDFIQHPVHPAIIYPLMGPCLLDTLRVVRLISRDAASLGSSSDVGKHKKDVLLRGLPMPLLKVVIYQILQFLSYAHARGIVHTDLKPENVLFESRTFLNQEVPIYACRPVAPAANAGRSTTPDNPRGASSAQPKFTKVLDHIIQVPLPHLNAIRVADLGSSLFTSTFRSKSLLDGVTPVSYSVIQTNHYRAPEVLLGVGWNASADIFSLGCMIPELLSGNCLFKPKDTMEHLAIMEQVLGPIHAESFPSKRKKRSTPKKSSTRSVGSDTSTSEKPVSTLSEVYTLNGLSYLHHFDPSTGRLRYPVTKQLVAARKARDEMVPPRPDESEPLVETRASDLEFVRGRPKLEEVLGATPELLDLTRRMLCYHPMYRITAEEAMQHPFFSTV